MLVTEMTKTVTNILKRSPTHFDSNIRHQHRCSFTNRTNLVSLWQCMVGCPLVFGTMKSKILFKAPDGVWTWITMEKYHTRKVFIDLSTNSIPSRYFSVANSTISPKIHLRSIYRSRQDESVMTFTLRL